MKYPRPACLDDRSAWHTSDSTWTAERKEKWRSVFTLLSRSDPKFAKGEMKALEAYFLTGRSTNPVRWAGQDAATVPLLFRLWFHPDQSDENWLQQIEATDWGDYQESEQLLHNIVGMNGPGLGGPDRRVWEALVGGSPLRTFGRYEYEYGRDGKGFYTPMRPREGRSGYGGSPLDIHGLRILLRIADKNPRCTTRFAVTRWIDDHEHKDWVKVFDGGVNEAALKHLFDLTRLLTSDTASDHGTSGQIDLAQELKALFDSGRGPAPFQNAWQEHGRSDAWKTDALKPPSWEE